MEHLFRLLGLVATDADGDRVEKNLLVAIARGFNIRLCRVWWDGLRVSYLLSNTDPLPTEVWPIYWLPNSHFLSSLTVQLRDERFIRPEKFSSGTGQTLQVCRAEASFTGYFRMVCSIMGLFHWHFWLQWVKPCNTDLHFYNAWAVPRHTRDGPFECIKLSSKQVAVTSRQLQPHVTIKKRVLWDPPHACEAEELTERRFNKCLFAILSPLEILQNIMEMQIHADQTKSSQANNMCVEKGN